MISETSRPYIAASVPVLREHGETITRTFYRNLFEAHPELTNLFNMANQASGLQQQSLAAAVFAYAANIDHPEALGPVIERIVQKHASLGVTAEHYPIVGQYLLGAIAQTLGDAATPELLAAWAEAYGSLADLFIHAERALYLQAGIAPGQMRAMRVTARRQESALVVSLELTPVDGLPLPAFKPGQYVSISIDLDSTYRQLRQYSLSDTPGKPTYRISVKREEPGSDTPAGQISNWIHDQAEVGSILHMTHPFGEFTPDTESNAPIVLLSAGVGITPMISVLNRIAAINPQRQVVFAHAALDRAHHAHQRDLAAAAAAMPNLQLVTFYEAGTPADGSEPGIHAGRMRLDTLPRWSYADTEVYLCGPSAFMHAQWRDLLEAGVPVERLHREVFGPELLDFLD
jgi:nitric oxide dioxygenase